MSLDLERWFRDPKRWCRKHPFRTLFIFVPACAGVGYGASALASGTLREALLVGSTTLIFGALFGGVVKFLLEDVQRARERRNEGVRFVTAILADLKSVYDRVERVRVLIVAHRSALTYGKEMRDLIDAAVQLRNVQRALDKTTSNIPEPHRTNLVRAVGSMEAYLNSLTDEFKEYYKPIADKQRIYEAAFEDFLKQAKPQPKQPANPAWQDLQQLVSCKSFARLIHRRFVSRNHRLTLRLPLTSESSLASWIGPR